MRISKFRKEVQVEKNVWTTGTSVPVFNGAIVTNKTLEVKKNTNPLFYI